MSGADKHAKTEAPTPRRKKEARRKGNVARSQEVSTWLSLLVASIVVPMVIANGGRSLRRLEASALSVVAQPDERAAMRVLGQGLGSVLSVVAPLMIAMVCVAILANVAQTRGAIATKKLKPTVSKLNPIAGFKRLFSPASWWEGAKSLIKVGILAFLGWKTMSHVVPQMITSGGLAMGSVATSIAKASVSFIRTASAVGFGLAMVDYIFQFKKIRKSLMMSKHEIKEESKMSEGSPLMKAEVKKRQFKMSRLRMMAEVAHADAIIVNPTHFAVAVKYESARGAPRVVAKGIDELALRIREEAEEHGVPIVEEPPLARTLYRACALGDEIPADLYEAVARVLAFLFTLKVRGKLQPIGGGTLRLPTPALRG